ncbi:carboxypeptidase S [[Candida] railenensis]|uniref:Carboxypeptidase S n=1 Tax=[Candida] railenensis TaxID=45579 RepID=A0A9P0QU67_9ASCO|nr:carboxypeptidase S [[Candida] railenensis]
MVSLPHDEDTSDVPVVVASKFRELKSKINENFKTAVGLAVVLVLLLVLLTTNTLAYAKIIFQPLNDASICPVYDVIAPAAFKLDNSSAVTIINDEKFRLQSISKLSKAVQVDTTVYDNQPDVDKEPETWSQFKEFHKYLKTTFPTVFALLEVDYVNTHGIVLYWKGSDSALKPVMLTAHQDVVPVQKDTLKDWSYPPFDGHYDGTWVYGRGSSDCKNILVAIMETLELLIDQKFKPKRGIIAAFGFDEEASGIQGARHISKFLEEKFGKDSIYAIVDEGSGVTKDATTGQVIAVAATGEKGYVDINVSLTTPGGHSSVPPDHTSIGIMGELAHLIESDPYSPILTAKNPILGYMQCLAVNTGDKLPSLTRKAILRAGFDKFANSKLVEVLGREPLTKYLIQTSQALDLMIGGEKANALPENVQLTVNHRISIESSVEAVQKVFTERVLEVAQKFDLGLEAFGKDVRSTKSKNGHFNVDFFSRSLEPAPISPSTGSVWKYLAGVTRHVFEDLVFTDLDYPIFLAPAVMPANTDTRYYWNLTKHIYRYSPFYTEDVMHDSRIHSVNERIKADSHLQVLAFFYEYVQAIDTADAG